MNLLRVRAMARKEMRHILRDVRSLIIALALPVIMLLLFGYALSLDVDQIPTLILDSDNSPQSRALIARFEGSRYFEILGFVDDYRSIESSIDRDECLIAVAIPKDFSRNLLTGKEVQVQLIIDGSDSNTASIALGYAEALVAAHALALQSSASNQEGGPQSLLPVEAQLRVWYNSDLKSQNYIIPGLLAVILMIISAMLTSLTIAREWEMGTMEQLLSTPLRPAELVLGKMSAYFAVGAIDTVIVIVVGGPYFRGPFEREPVFPVCQLLHLSLWSPLLGNLALCHCRFPACGLSTGNDDLVFTGFSPLRLHLFHREHARSHSDVHLSGTGPLLHHPSQRDFSQGGRT